MKSKTPMILGGVTGLLLALLAVVVVTGKDDLIRDAWAQAKTVMYRDSQQVVTVPHTYTMPTAGPPLTVTGPSLGIPATGFAPDMLGGSPLSTLGAVTPAGKIRRLTDGGAAGAMVLSDGTKWDCAGAREQKIHIVTCPPYNAKGDGVTNDSAAFTAAFGTGGRKVFVPPGTYLVASVIFQSNLNIEGAGVGITTLKLPNATHASVFVNYEVTPVNNLELSHMTIDGNGAAQVSPSFTVLGLNGATNFWFHHLEVKNSVEYCVGLENGVLQGKISEMSIGPCRTDGIDIKNTVNNTRIEVANVKIVDVGSTIGANVGGLDAVCLDSGGRNRLTNIYCKMKGQTNGINFRRQQTTGSNCSIAFCEGGQGSSLNNFYIEGDGVTTLASNGVWVRDAFVQVNNGYVRGMGRGVYIESDLGFGEARDVLVSNVVAEGSGIAGFQTGATATFSSFLNCTSVNSKNVGGSFTTGSVRFIGGSVSSSAGNGISVAGTSTHVKIQGSNLSSNGRYGVEVYATTNSVTVIGNTIVANTLGQVLDLGTNTIVQQNTGVKTADNGQVTLPAGATSVVVNHGLAWSPEPSGISLTAMGNSTNDVGMVYVDSSVTTEGQFTIKTRNAPGGAGLPIGWRAIVKY